MADARRRLAGRICLGRRTQNAVVARELPKRDAQYDFA
jgi:hypothetical protein